ncbi:hypothetical protein [Fluviicola chungangensis]|uniref:Lipoprotein n=1 Tax=Fluviicola chungangensis TaxID=2597671 RepID=A0A556N6W4_9FLAO|nr:hypothetical protein [Fluviicola chungangensis]TSJ47917.1 hypothetical protein FO442_01950 [Fluviicola chungangensis]
MKRTNFAITLLILSQGIFLSCSSNAKKDTPKADEPVTQVDSSLFQKESVYAELLKKFKPISFDTLEVTYEYDTKDKRFKGQELTLKEAKIFPLGITENFFGKLSGVYACYQFPLDSTYIGLIARIPGEYDANSVGLFIFDRQKDQLLKEYLHLSVDFGDAGDVYGRTSWLIKSKNKQYQSLAYDYSAYYHEVEDTNDHTVDEWEEYYLFNCMSPKFDTISKNGTRLKKQFKRILKTVN